LYIKGVESTKPKEKQNISEVYWQVEIPALVDEEIEFELQKLPICQRKKLNI
jgi:hypothetical protein